MKFTNILYKLLVDPWVIVPAMHQTLCAIVRDHMSGMAHAPGGRAAVWAANMDDDMMPVPPDKKKSMVSGNIARIEISGVIGRRLGDLEKSSGGLDLLDVAAELKAATESPDVGGILLVFDSPGGAVGGVPEVCGQIRAAAAQKPIVALAAGLMASGAYWLGSQATMIVAESSAQVGSIGAYQAFLDESRNYASEGLAVELFKSGKFKGMGISGLPLTDEQRAYMQGRVDKVFGWFKEAVKVNRDVPESAMDGRVFFADEALALDMIDAIGDEDMAVAELRDLMARPA